MTDFDRYYSNYTHFDATLPLLLFNKEHVTTFHL